MRKFSLLILLTIILFVSCNAKGNSVELQIADKTIQVEIADTNQLRSLGLMNRETLEKNKGMLFIFENERKLSFWMKNTRIPLSIAYIAKNGEIKEIYDMYPLDETAVKSTRSVLYALEMNQGWFKENNIHVGDRIIIPENL
ncbi:MAG: DUF192 domain-containing protein [Spirochaetaceae bacterium]|jgi:uncharacterized membrane protein (UPF0127 family)|nr:DUF192 domain-containing protein [Spirochaetaceae bacterium]